eukprot:6186173-Pleurochrysis_carterae.AAC.7
MAPVRQVCMHDSYACRCMADKRTALHVAASEGSRRTVESLLDGGADINVKDRWGGTPIRDAIKHGHTVGKMARTIVAYAQ